MYVTKEELLKGRDIQFASEYTDVISYNLDQLLIPLNKLREAYGSAFLITSGWRPKAVNKKTFGAAQNSKHLQGLAADVYDPNGLLWKWVLNNLQMLKDLNIYCEDKRWTPTWVHFQLGGPASGHRIFIPSVTRPLAPSAWDGQYNKEEFDT